MAFSSEVVATSVADTPSSFSSEVATLSIAAIPFGYASEVITLFVNVNNFPLLRLEQARAPLIAVLRAADMNTTADRVIGLSPKRYIIRRVIITNASTGLTTAVGGIYTGPGKTGVALVPAGQSYAALTSSNKFIDATLHASAFTDHYAVSALYLSLTTPQGAPATADIYIYGDSVEA